MTDIILKKDIDNYLGYYQIDSLGNVWATRKYKDRILKFWICNSGYKTVGLWLKGKGHNYTIHRLVAQYFILNPEKKSTVNHKDGNKLNNNLNNLEWMTQAENLQHAYNTGLSKYSPKKYDYSGVNNPCSISVGQYDINMNLITIFGSAKEAQRKTGIHQASISRVCRGIGKIAGGYKWRNHEQNNY